MILLDTNIVSEAMSSNPDVRVIEWMRNQPAANLFVSTVTIAEITYGIRILAAGKRRQMLERAFDRFIASGFAYRVLAFDEKAARGYGELMAERRKQGRPMSILDGQIAAIARSGSLAVATRNVADFGGCGLEILNPFEAIE